MGEGNIDTPSLLLQDLMKTVPGGLPLIIKLDIEGAEGEVCRSAPELLRKAACLLIEPHDYLKSRLFLPVSAVRRVEGAAGRHASGRRIHRLDRVQPGQGHR